jgi:nucleoside-diphosphate-sugar epimerase
MKILITGACGVLGRAVRRVAAAAGDGHTFVLFDQAEQVTRDAGICGSITDHDLVQRAAEGCDAIIHTAAMHGAFRNKRSNADFIHTNVIGAEYLFEAALKHGIKRLAFASTMEVLVGLEWNCFGTAELDETFNPRPDWIYPVSKYQVEILGHFYARYHGFEVVQLRYMAFDDAPWEKLGLGLLNRYISADDVGRATLAAATKSGLRDEVLNIGPETPLTQRDTNEAMTDPAKPIERHWPGAMAILQKHALAPTLANFWPITRIERAKRVLDWQPQDTFEKFLDHLGWRRA